MTAVLLTGSRAPATLELARHFAAAGVFVVVADSQPALASGSRSVGKAYRVPSARFRPREFAAAVAGIARRHAVDLVICCNEEIFWLAAALAEARAVARVAGTGREADAGADGGTPIAVAELPLFAPPLDVLRRLHDKAAFGELLGELGIRHPETTVVSSRLQWRRLSEARRRAGSAAASARGARPDASRASGTGSSAAVVVKPAFSRFGARTRFVAPGEALPEPGRVTRDERWLVQERVVGDEFSSHAVAVGGRLTAFVAYRSVSRAGAGAGVAFERVDPSEAAAVEARRIASLLAAELDLTGQFGLDLIERTDARPGEVVVLECNPRATSGLHLFTRDGGLAAAFTAPGTFSAERPEGFEGGYAVETQGEVDPVDPVTPVDSVDPVQPVDPVTPVDPVQPVDHTTPVDSVDPVHPVDPVHLVDRVHPVDPVDGTVMGARASGRLGLPHLLYGLPGIRSAADVRRFVRQLRSPDVLRAPGDAVPLGVLARSLAVQLSTAFRAGVPLLDASTHDIEWNGEPLPPRRAAGAPWVPEFVSGFEPAAPPPVDDLPSADGPRPPTSAPGAGDARRRPLVANADVLLDGIEVGGVLLPLSRPRPAAERAHAPSADSAPASYVVSPITHYVHYAREELRLVESGAARAAGRVALAVLERVLRAGRADDVAIVGNALLSTNLLPDLGEAAVADVTRRLVAAHPELAIGWRSVHGRGTRLPESLRENGYRLIPSRSVLFAPTRDTEWERLRDVARDRALLETSGYAARPAPIDAGTGTSDSGTLERIAALYGMLYLDKYSRLNPEYSPEFVALAQRSGLLRFLLLERDGRIDGVIGYTVAHGLLAAPVVGYDTALPAETGLYRMLSYLIARTAHDEGVDLHASSGVADFKRNRGAEPELEYFAVTAGHLGLRNRAAWAALDLLVSRVAAPAVLRAGL